MREFNANEKFIFVSYAHKDKDRVIPIIKELRERGCRVWYDEGLHWGETWSAELTTRIKECFLFMIFKSRASMASDEVYNEFFQAIKHQKQILPILLECSSSLKFDYYLDPIQYLDCTSTTTSTTTYVDKLVDALPNDVFADGVDLTEVPKNQPKRETPKIDFHSVKNSIGGEYFTFTNEEYKKQKKSSKLRYKAYNSDGENVGYVHEYYEKNKVTPALHMAELGFDPLYKGKQFCRFTSHGQRIPWEDLKKRIETEGKVRLYID